MKKLLIVIPILCVLLFGTGYLVFKPKPEPKFVYHSTATSTPERSPQLINSTKFICQGGKTIDASFYKLPGFSVQASGTPRVPEGSVTVTLSDGRSRTLQQTISADGGRYADEGESFIFWNKGNGARVIEYNEEKDFTNCIVVDTAHATDLPEVYASREGSFSLRLPSIAASGTDGYIIDESFKDQVLPKKVLEGVRFTVPLSMATGTNLSKNSYVAVEYSTATSTCDPNLFLSDFHATTSLSDGGSTYVIATSSDAAAGNRFEETIYAIPGTSPCIAIHYFIHYSAFENYATGTVVEFDRAALINQFDAIRETLIINQ